MSIGRYKHNYLWLSMSFVYYLYLRLLLLSRSDDCYQVYITSGLNTDKCGAMRTNSSGAVAIPKGRSVY